MSYNYAKLLGRVVEKFGTQANFSKQMGISARSLSLKLNNHRLWKQNEIATACALLEIPQNDVTAYFFTPEVQIY